MTSMIDTAWHMAAWSEEVGEQLLSRRLTDRRLLLFRKQNGEVAMMDDRCPHRFAPLSLGTRIDDTVVCGYHGLTFDADGRCVRNPFSTRIPSAAKVPSYKVVERDSIVWFWPGSAESADDALIPDFSFLPNSATNRTIHGYMVLEANYEYGTDNLMDLSHIEFVHKGSFAGAGVIFQGEHEVIQDGDTLRSNWWMPNVAAPSHTIGIYPPEMRVDHWLDMRWNAPASMHLHIGSTPEGQPREAGLTVDQAHILTPETEGRTHYFWASTRDTMLEDTEMDAMLISLFGQAFDEEDKPIIKAAYDNLEGAEFWASKPISLGIDAGGTRARRVLEKLRSKEREGMKVGK